MKTRYRIAINLGLLHIFLAILGNYRVDVFANEDLEDALTVYQQYSGAAQGYEFFAPNVSGASRVRFQLYHPDGKITTAQLPPEGVNSEVRLRVGNVFNVFWDHRSKDDIIRSLTASWAGTFFSRQPELTKVTVTVQEYQLPTMHLYAKGATSYWLDVYSATYTKSKGSGSST